jgi:hypothetical protein
MPRDPFPLAVEIAEAIDCIPETDLQTVMEATSLYGRTCKPSYSAPFPTFEAAEAHFHALLDRHVGEILGYAARQGVGQPSE